LLKKDWIESNSFFFHSIRADCFSALAALTQPGAAQARTKTIFYDRAAPSILSHIDLNQSMGQSLLPCTYRELTA